MKQINTDNHFELISVIIPVFNVEKYLSRCLDSVINQTYKNLDIILIDDGSSDSSGKICEEYKDKDSRIRVIHQTNSGQAHARNVGINIAKGSYITFIDSDDWIKINFIETLYNYMNLYDIDIVSSRLINSYHKNNKLYYISPRKFPTSILNKIEALEYLFYRTAITPTPCGRLYKAKLFKNIRFPENKIFEDFAIIYKIIDASNKILIVEYNGYYYYQRLGSTVNSDFQEKDLVALSFSKEIIQFVKRKYPILNKAANSVFVDMNHVLYLKIIKSKNNKYNHLKKEFYKNILLNCKYVLLNTKARTKLKIKVLLIILGDIFIKSTLKILKLFNYLPL